MLVGWSAKGGSVLARCRQTSPISSLGTITKCRTIPSANSANAVIRCAAFSYLGNIGTNEDDLENSFAS